MDDEARSAQADSHATTERLRAARDAHLAAREASEGADAGLRRLRADFDSAEATVARLTERLAELDAALAQEPVVGADPEPTTLGRLAELQDAADRARAERDERARRRDAAREEWNATRGEAEGLETRVAGRRQQRSVREARVAQLSAGLPDRRASVERLAAERADLATAAVAAREADGEASAAQERAESERSARRTELLELRETRAGEERGSGSWSARHRPRPSRHLVGTRRWPPWRGSASWRWTGSRRRPRRRRATRSRRWTTAHWNRRCDASDGPSPRSARSTHSPSRSIGRWPARLEEMSGQDADLRGAIESTEELIATLDAEIEKQFDAAFQAIGEKFDEFCRLLFAGGSASLQRSDEADGDAAGGIEIVVRPPGKRLQRLAMLSGGERALTGVALLFAMLTVNPVPFCILDEVDAALDEANIGRFAEALRKLSESIDFVVITHNRATIEVADTIYGVTMTDAAVSRVLSLRLADVPVEVGA